jgi:hypothetical protein
LTRPFALGAVLSAATTLALAGCGGGSASPVQARPAASPSVAPAALATAASRCSRAALPAGYTPDRAHTGALTSHTYSTSADVQAALQFDQLSAGRRQVFLHRTGNRVDGVVSCVTLTFPSSDQAGRFFGSYRTLRKQAGALVTRLSRVPHVSGLQGTVGYVERQQSFRGYRINSTTVLEVAGLSGTTLDIVSVAGGSPSTHLASALAKSLARQA